MEELKNKYYIRLNEDGRIIKCFSDVFEEPLENDILISEDYGSQFRITSEVLSQDLQQCANVENGLILTDENGIYILKYEDSLIQKLTDEEYEMEIDNLPVSEPTKMEVLEKENLALMETLTQIYEKNLELEQQSLDIMEALIQIYEATL